MLSFRYITAAALLQLASSVIAHEHEEHASNGMDGMKMGGAHHPAGNDEVDKYALPNYFSLDKHANMMLAHIVLMVLAWVFVLPTGKSLDRGSNNTSCT